MMTRNKFVALMLRTADTVSSSTAPADATDSLPGRFGEHGFDIQATPTDDNPQLSFARQLFDAADLGDPEHLERAQVILGENEAARSLPEAVFYWPKTGERPHHTLLFELKQTTTELLDDNLFRDLRKEKRFHDAAHRLIQYAQTGFAKGGEKRDAAVKKGQPEETLVVLSMHDEDRGAETAVNIIHFGTVSAEHHSFESFFITDEVRRWAPRNPALADEHLSRLFFRHFSPLAGDSWQDAFLTGKERKLARNLLDACHLEAPDPRSLQKHVTTLLIELGKSFGSGDHAAKLVFEDLPRDHFIGVDPSEARKLGFQNAFQGITVRDDTERLLGYVIYCLDEKSTAAKLRAALQEHNSFHNVLLIYPDGDRTELELWQGSRPLRGKLTKAGAQFSQEGELVNLLSRFFIVSKSDIESPIHLARALAERARYLRLIALGELKQERKAAKGKRPVLDLYEVFDKALARQTEEEFSDAYAQTLTYGLLAARWISRHSSKPFTGDTVRDHLPGTSPFLKDLFEKLMALRIAPRLRWLIEDIIRLLNRTSVSEVFEKQQRDPVIHFYEDFLDEYDPQIRKDRGVYYTPDEVVSYIVRTAHSALQSQFGLKLGLADTTSWSAFAERRGVPIPAGVTGDEPFVQLLDPATGTGTFLLRVIQIVHETMMAEYSRRKLDAATTAKEWVSYVRDHLLPRINGFELMMAPYIVSHLRLGLALEETGFVFAGKDRLRVFLTNTLEVHSNVQLNWIGEHVAEEAREADRVKTGAPVSVIIGNPPYDRHRSDATLASGWLRSGDATWNDARPLLDDYTAPVLARGGGGDLKNLYNLYVYFWRWCTWRVFENIPRPGIVALITPSSFLRGPAFRGLRQHLRASADSLNVLDLEGDQFGTRKTENVFFITIPVAICSAIRVAQDASRQAIGRYYRVTGSRAEKLRYCGSHGSLDTVAWEPTFAEPDEPLMGKAEGGIVDYVDLPEVSRIFPWSHTGAEFQRTWPIAETPEVLERRWSAFLGSADRAKAFVENRDRKIGNVYQPLFDLDRAPHPALASEATTAAAPRIERFGFRSFQRFWCFADNRIGTVLKPVLWHGLSTSQVFLTSLLTGVLGIGPGATVTAYVPDKHHFRGSYGGKDVIPLWRNPEATEANVSAGCLSALERVYRATPRPEDVFSYTYAVLANPGYVKRFEDELQVPGPRLPVTKDAELFARGAALGRELIRWHTFGERFREKGDGLKLSGSAKVRTAIPGSADKYPERHRYDETKQSLAVGAGEISPVSPEVWSFSVSGLQVVKSWLDYRMKKGAGKKSSPLDDIRPEQWTPEMTRELLELLWVLEWTCSQYPALDAWLEEVLASSLFTAQEIPEPTEAERKEPKLERNRQGTLLR